MKIWVTGGAGFIGSNLIRALNKSGYENIVVIDDLTDGRKIFNLNKVKIADYVDYTSAEKYMNDEMAPQMIFHQGACSDTGEWNGKYIMENNYEFSKKILSYACTNKIKLTYASSASVYGKGKVFKEDSLLEMPINAYAYSKYLFDKYVGNAIGNATTQIVGLRYFNVYGPGEGHKGRMASVIYHMNNALENGEEIKLFRGTDGYADGDQMRDFVHVDDIAAVNMWTMDNEIKSGVYNCGTGKARSFNDIANAVIAAKGEGSIKYIDIPETLIPSYQSYTKADIGKLRSAHYRREFINIEEGIEKYIRVTKHYEK